MTDYLVGPPTLDWPGWALQAFYDNHIKTAGRGSPTYNCLPCARPVALRPRSISDQQALSMLTMLATVGTDYGHVPTIVGRKSSEEAKLKYWGLFEEHPGQRLDGGHAGMWRITDKGSLWTRGLISVPKTAWCWNKQAIRVDGPPFHIEDALKNPFDLARLLAAIP